MLPEEVIYTYLSTQQDICNLVQDRIFPILMPQESKPPAITYQRISTVRKNILQGRSDFASIIIQFNCWSDKYSVSKALADYLVKCIQYVNQLADAGIEAAFIVSEIDRYEPDTKSYCVDVDIEIHYIENRLG